MDEKTIMAILENIKDLTEFASEIPRGSEGRKETIDKTIYVAKSFIQALKSYR